MPPPVVDLIQHITELAALTGGLVVQVDDRADLLERETEPLAAQNQIQTRPFAATVDACSPATLGGDEVELLVVANGSVGDRELLRDLPDRPGLRVVCSPLVGRPCVVSCSNVAGRISPCHVAQNALR